MILHKIPNSLISRILGLWAFIFLTLPGSAGSLPYQSLSQPTSSFFSAGEQLRYGITLWGIPAGRATMEVRQSDPVQGLPAFQFQTVARSNDFVSVFFPVHNEVFSTVHAETLLPWHMVFHRREGKRHEDFDLSFNRRDQQVTVVKNGQSSQLPLSPEALDPLSCLYYVRNFSELVPGTSMFLNIFHDRKHYSVEVQIEGYEKLVGPWGEKDTVRVLVVMPFRGIFLNEGNIRIWFSHDHRRIPLMMQARVIIGSVEAKLDSPI